MAEQRAEHVTKIPSMINSLIFLFQIKSSAEIDPESQWQQLESYRWNNIVPTVTSFLSRVAGSYVSKQSSHFFCLFRLPEARDDRLPSYARFGLKMMFASFATYISRITMNYDVCIDKHLCSSEAGLWRLRK